MEEYFYIFLINIYLYYINIKKRQLCTCKCARGVTVFIQALRLLPQPRKWFLCFFCAVGREGGKGFAATFVTKTKVP